MADEKKAADIQPPSWLDAAFIQDALNRGEKVDSSLTNFTIRSASSVGDNYASMLYRVKATLADGEERSLIVKVMPPGAIAHFVREAGLFKVESLMYADVVPAIQAILDAADPHRPPLTPRCLHHGSHPVEFLVLEDLAPDGFKMANRYQGLGLRHCLLALRTLARFHAASAALMERDPSAANGLVNPFRLKSPSMEVLLKIGPHGAATACRLWPGFEEYGALLDAYADVVADTCFKLHEPKPETFNVILHGDFWMNNMMFRYEDEEPIAVRLFDLQMSHVGPAVVDILHFFGCSLSESVSTHHQDLLIREYHKALVEAMDLLGLKPPSLDNIVSDLNSHGTVVLTTGLSLLPVTKVQKVPNTNDLVAGNLEAVRSLYDDPVVRRWFQRTLPEYRRKGWLPG